MSSTKVNMTFSAVTQAPSFLVETRDDVQSAPSRLLLKLRCFADFQAGWSHGSGVPITSAAIAAAEELVLAAAQLQLKADVFPEPDGSCAVAFYRGEHKVEVRAYSDGKHFGLRAERGIGFQFQDTIDPIENATRSQIYLTLIPLAIGETWPFGSLISDSLTELVDASGMSSTEIHQPPQEDPLRTDVGGFQSSMLYAPVAA